MNEASLNNLIPADSKRASEIGKLGGKASVKTKRAKKTFKEIAKQMLEMKPNKEVIKRILKEYPDLDQKQVTQRTVMLSAQLRKAMKGNTKAFEIIRDTAGEKPIEQTETSHVFNKMSQVSLDGQALTFDVGEGVDVIDTTPVIPIEGDLNNITERGTYTPDGERVDDE